MAAKKPNILILWGDDIGIWNISHFSRGMMGYRTPNIDRIAKEGVTFTDYYSQQSCTAGRACFICGQNPIRTGLTKVGMPGATVGLQKEDPTIAELLKPLGYATGQFGKNHLGDRDEFLPTVHGFDEFFGNLYHLNAEEEPELPDYPKDPAFKKQFGPRGVLHCKADGKGGQTIVDTGPLTKKRMETIDEEITDRALAWMEAQAKADKPFFLWYNATAMHFRTHVAEKNLGKSGQDPYSDRMVVHDEQIGMMLDKLDELGIADNTIVMYSTDNGPENDTWPDGATTPFRGQKDSNWEGGWRVPCFMRWPGKIKPDSVLNGIVSHIDMFPTLAGCRRQSGRHQAIARWLHGGREEIQRPSRRLQHDSLPDRPGEGKPETRHHLLQRRRRGHRGAGRRLEIPSGRAARQYDEAVGRAVRQIAAAVHHEHASRSVRARRIQLEHLSGLDGRSRASDVHDAGIRRAADRRLRQVPAEAEARFVQPRRGAGAGDSPRLRRRACSSERQGARPAFRRCAAWCNRPMHGPIHAWVLFLRRRRHERARITAGCGKRRGGGAHLLRRPSLSAARRRPREIPGLARSAKAPCGVPFVLAFQDLREDISILVAGCGTSQAAKHAMRWPAARVTGIDFSETSVRCTEELKRKYQLDNLQVRQLPLERARELETSFDQIVCTGVLHHLPDPDAGLGLCATSSIHTGRCTSWCMRRMEERASTCCRISASESV